MKRRGFSLIEVLLVVAVVAGLAAMLFLGFNHVSQRAKWDATRVTMQTLRAMVTEYETASGSIDKIERLYDSKVTPGPAPDFKPAPPEFPADFQIRAPSRSVVDDPSGTDRQNKVVLKTRLVMARLLSVPANRAVLDSLPPSTVERTADGVVLLDAHRNPIIYVPGHGITHVNLQKRSNSNSEQVYEKPNQTITSPDGHHGFWLSAGADARFDRGDDNQSSLDQ
jgi:prepilin-type N-terminal cleavage/methylation domain-containing protein